MFRSVGSLLLVLPLAATAAAQGIPPPVEKRCVFAAAEKLPPIPGLVATSSRVGPMPKSMDKVLEVERERYRGTLYALNIGGKNTPVSTLVVELDVRAAGQDGTYSFACFSASGGPTRVHLLGLVK